MRSKSEKERLLRECFGDDDNDESTHTKHRIESRSSSKDHHRRRKKRRSSSHSPSSSKRRKHASNRWVNDDDEDEDEDESSKSVIDDVVEETFYTTKKAMLDNITEVLPESGEFNSFVMKPSAIDIDSAVDSDEAGVECIDLVSDDENDDVASSQVSIGTTVSSWPLTPPSQTPEEDEEERKLMERLNNTMTSQKEIPRDVVTPPSTGTPPLQDTFFDHRLINDESSITARTTQMTCDNSMMLPMTPPETHHRSVSPSPEIPPSKTEVADDSLNTLLPSQPNHRSIHAAFSVNECAIKKEDQQRDIPTPPRSDLNINIHEPPADERLSAAKIIEPASTPKDHSNASNGTTRPPIPKFCVKLQHVPKNAIVEVLGNTFEVPLELTITKVPNGERGQPGEGVKSTGEGRKENPASPPKRALSTSESHSPLSAKNKRLSVDDALFRDKVAERPDQITPKSAAQTNATNQNFPATIILTKSPEPTAPEVTKSPNLQSPSSNTASSSCQLPVAPTNPRNETRDNTSPGIRVRTDLQTTSSFCQPMNVENSRTTETASFVGRGRKPTNEAEPLNQSETPQTFSLDQQPPQDNLVYSEETAEWVKPKSTQQKDIKLTIVQQLIAAERYDAAVFLVHGKKDRLHIPGRLVDMLNNELSSYIIKIGGTMADHARIHGELMKAIKDSVRKRKKTPITEQHPLQDVQTQKLPSAGSSALPTANSSTDNRPANILRQVATNQQNSLQSNSTPNLSIQNPQVPSSDQIQEILDYFEQHITPQQMEVCRHLADTVQTDSVIESRLHAERQQQPIASTSTLGTSSGQQNNHMPPQRRQPTAHEVQQQSQSTTEPVGCIQHTSQHQPLRHILPKHPIPSNQQNVSKTTTQQQQGPQNSHTQQAHQTIIPTADMSQSYPTNVLEDVLKFGEGSLFSRREGQPAQAAPPQYNTAAEIPQRFNVPPPAYGMFNQQPLQAGMSQSQQPQFGSSSQQTPQQFQQQYSPIGPTPVPAQQNRHTMPPTAQQTRHTMPPTAQQTPHTMPSTAQQTRHTMPSTAYQHYRGSPLPGVGMSGGQMWSGVSMPQPRVATSPPGFGTSQGMPHSQNQRQYNQEARYRSIGYGAPQRKVLAYRTDERATKTRQWGRNYFETTETTTTTTRYGYPYRPPLRDGKGQM